MNHIEPVLKLDNQKTTVADLRRAVQRAMLIIIATTSCELQNPILRFPPDSSVDAADSNTMVSPNDGASEDRETLPDAISTDVLIDATVDSLTTEPDIMSLEDAPHIDTSVDSSTGEDRLITDEDIVVPNDTSVGADVFDAGISEDVADVSVIDIQDSSTDSGMTIDVAMPIDTAMDSSVAIDTGSTDIVDASSSEPFSDTGSLTDTGTSDTGVLEPNGCRLTTLYTVDGRDICASGTCEMSGMRSFDVYTGIEFGSNPLSSITSVTYDTVPSGDRNIRGSYIRQRDISTVPLPAAGGIVISVNSPTYPPSTVIGLTNIRLNSGARNCGNAFITIR